MPCITWKPELAIKIQAIYKCLLNTKQLEKTHRTSLLTWILNMSNSKKPRVHVDNVSSMRFMHQKLDYGSKLVHLNLSQACLLYNNEDRKTEQKGVYNHLSHSVKL